MFMPNAVAIHPAAMKVFGPQPVDITAGAVGTQDQPHLNTAITAADNNVEMALMSTIIAAQCGTSVMPNAEVLKASVGPVIGNMTAAVTVAGTTAGTAAGTCQTAGSDASTGRATDKNHAAGKGQAPGITAAGRTVAKRKHVRAPLPAVELSGNDLPFVNTKGKNKRTKKGAV